MNPKKSKKADSVGNPGGPDGATAGADGAEKATGAKGKPKSSQPKDVQPSSEARAFKSAAETFNKNSKSSYRSQVSFYFLYIPIIDIQTIIDQPSASEVMRSVVDDCLTFDALGGICIWDSTKLCHF